MTTYDHWLLDGPGGPHDDAPECSHCCGPLTTMADKESGECEQCWRDRNDAQNAIEEEFDRLNAEADAQEHDEPEPVCCGAEPPF
jgi:hypothetical protein